jgi:glycosyltransferase involved in cell wall biosynthesis
MQDEALAQGLAEAGYARVRRDFSRATIVERYIELYSTLLGST